MSRIPMNNRDDKAFESKLVDILDQSTTELDDATRYRLQLARAEVLEYGERSVPWYRRLHTWATATGLASVFTVVFLVTNNFPAYTNKNIELTSDADINLIDDEIGVELYEEYDFYVWLSQQEVSS